MIYIDIETIPPPSKPDRDSLKIPGNISKPETIEKWKDENLESEWRKEALNSLKGQIICIGIINLAFPAGLSLFDNDEKKLLTLFVNNYLKSSDEICGHNLLGFDAPFIFHRCLKYGIKPPLQFRTQKHEMLFDTMLMFDPFRWKQYYSLKSLAEFFGIEKNNDIKGDQLFDLYQVGEHDKIREHCLDDVRVTKQVYERLKF